MSNTKNDKFTTIQVSKEVQSILKDKKIIDREPYNDVIKRFRNPDTQKIKQMNIIGNEGTDEDKKEAIMGALRLYLDFINLFLMLLRIFGRRD